MACAMSTKERLLLIAKYSESLVGFRENVETLSINDSLGYRVYLLAIMLDGIEQSEYVKPDPDVEHLTWVFHQTARLMVKTVVDDVDFGVIEAYEMFKRMRDDLLYG